MRTIHARLLATAVVYMVLAAAIEMARLHT